KFFHICICIFCILNMCEKKNYCSSKIEIGEIEMNKIKIIQKKLHREAFFKLLPKQIEYILSHPQYFFE
ncbi:hypothetical protein ACFLY2_02680, partial [Patescibacteria group bacterium]